MAGIGNNITAMEDWMPLSPSHRNFFSNLMFEEFDRKSFSNGNDGLFVKSKDEENVVDVKDEGDEAGLLFSDDLLPKVNNAHKPSLTERRAARAGFSAPTINTDQIRPANFASLNSEIQSPYLTIPPGLSPTTLLDSPVFLSNSLAQTSPTTGTFSFSQYNTDQFTVLPDQSEDCLSEGINPRSLDVKPPLGSSPFSFSTGRNQSASTIDAHQSLPCIGSSLQNVNEIKSSADDIDQNQRPSNPTTTHEHSPPLDNNSQEDEKVESSSLAIGAPAEDGYNWRKYGQKHVKGSEYPRSYYKCTHANCPVKKKVERNHEGQVTEIIYKGAHNHPKPPLNRRSGVLSSHPFNEYQSENGLEITLPMSGPNDFCENQEAGEVSSTLSNEDDDDDRVTHGSVSLGCDGEGEESESKRRKVEAGMMEMSAGSRAVREPRVVVQTTSEIDILDDGYRWRKYGQKVVKGNPNPRSYYKCTNPGCSVRKHVERASNDLKSVITTYEGKHNHEVPAARGTTNVSTNPQLPTSITSSGPPQPPRPQENHFQRYEVPAPFTSSLNLPARDRFGSAPANFAFGVGPNAAMSRYGPIGLPSVNGYMGLNRHGVEPGYGVPKGEVKEEMLSDLGASAYYHQLMERMPLGHQM